MPSETPSPWKRRALWALLWSAVAALAVTALLVSIFERKQEARQTFFPVAPLSDEIEDPAVWGKNFPHQYDAWRRTVDMTRTRYGGSEALPRSPTQADPRSVVAQSKLEKDPRLRTMWAGYPFAVDFREERGHAYMLIDQRYSRRVLEFNQPGTCLNCHASSYGAMRRLGNGDLFAGFEKLNAMPYAEAVKFVEHPVACIDCHDPAGMRLRITRPAFLEGIRNLKAAQGVRDYDPNRMASAQEMRTYVCAQCHVEYYFQGPGKKLVYPWHNGLQVEQMYAYYQQVAHTDWTHQETGAPLLKAQHPEFEFFQQGVHARSEVACADCHMPYRREGGVKVSDHHVRSPLLNINRACQGCHRQSEEEIRNRVELIQSRFFHTRDAALDALMDLIGDLKQAREAGAPEAVLRPAREFHRQAQFYLDMAEAENSTGFHAPQELMRVLALAIDLSRKGQLVLRRPAGSSAAARPENSGAGSDTARAAER